MSTQNLATFTNLGVPGSLSFGLTPDDYQQDLSVSTSNSLELLEVSSTLDKLSAYLYYTYARTFYHDAAYQDSTHRKHKTSARVEGIWNLGQSYSLQTDFLYTLDYVDSTDVGQNMRHAISTAANGSLYFMDGIFSLHPSLNVAYLSDIQALSPNASIGAIYTPLKGFDIKATISYAENVPTFSQLYWPFMGNPNLKTEKGLNGEVVLSTTLNTVTYEGTLFGRNIYNDIAYDSSWVPQNIAHSVYLGTEQTLTLKPSGLFNLQASYLYNKSYDLSAGKTFTDNVEVSHIRKHTAKGSLFLTLNRFKSVLSAEYLGKTSTLDSAFLLNLSITMQVTETLKTYLAVDNLLNTSYELTTGGYPMPGTKIRIGGTLRF